MRALEILNEWAPGATMASAVSGTSIAIRDIFQRQSLDKGSL